MKMRIQELRKAAKMSQEALATRAGISVSALQKIEQASRDPRGSSLRGIADALDVTVDDLFDTAEVAS